MKIFSQNILNYGIPVPEKSILRINLAWINSMEDLTFILKKNKNSDIFLDLPIGRTKPPNNKYSFEDILTIIQNYKNITYFAVSNVNSPNDIQEFIGKIPERVSLVPKIESPEGVKNIKDITDLLGPQKVIMLDHDDLYSNLIRKNEKPEKFKEYVASLSNFCQNNNVIMLRTIGVIFSDDETRLTDYVN